MPLTAATAPTAWTTDTVALGHREAHGVQHPVEERADGDQRGDQDPQLGGHVEGGGPEPRPAEAGPDGDAHHHQDRDGHRLGDDPHTGRRSTRVHSSATRNTMPAAAGSSMVAATAQRATPCAADRRSPR